MKIIFGIVGDYEFIEVIILDNQQKIDLIFPHHCSHTYYKSNRALANIQFFSILPSTQEDIALHHHNQLSGNYLLHLDDQHHEFLDKVSYKKFSLLLWYDDELFFIAPPIPLILALNFQFYILMWGSLCKQTNFIYLPVDIVKKLV